MANERLAPNGMPRVTAALAGSDGNAIAIISRCLLAMRRARWPLDHRMAFAKEAVRSDYDHLLRTVTQYVDEPTREPAPEERRVG